jgi:hypothetical protein
VGAAVPYPSLRRAHPFRWSRASDVSAAAAAQLDFFPPLRPAAFFCAWLPPLPPPLLFLLRLEPELLPPRLELPSELQHIHGLLEVVPLMATSFLTVLHWDQARALFSLGDEQPRFRPELKRRPLPANYIAALGAAITAFIVLPYGEEIWRCRRAERSTG